MPHSKLETIPIATIALLSTTHICNKSNKENDNDDLPLSHMDKKLDLAIHICGMIEQQKDALILQLKI